MNDPRLYIIATIAIAICATTFAVEIGPKLLPKAIRLYGSFIGVLSGCQRILHRHRRSVLCVTALTLACVTAWGAIKWQSYRYQRGIADELMKAGVEVHWESGDVIGLEFFDPYSNYPNAIITKDLIAKVNRLPRLRWLNFSYSNLDDTMLSELAGHPYLQSLSIDCTKTTSIGIENLATFPRLWDIHVLVEQLDGKPDAVLLRHNPHAFLYKLVLIDGRRVGEEFAGPDIL